MGCNDPDSKAHGANMGPNWGRQDPGGFQVGPMNFAIWVIYALTPVAVQPTKLKYLVYTN